MSFAVTRQRSSRPARLVLAVALLLGAVGTVLAAPDAPPLLSGGTDPHASEVASLRQALIALPVAGALGAVLAFRPQRRGTPKRQSAVIHAQIILTLVGALVMLVVGASIARAFGIVGAASLVRYRAKVEDPKDAGIMLSCLGIGLASGVGIYWVATFATLFTLGVVWVLESVEPQQLREVFLQVKAKDSPELRADIDKVLKRNKIANEVRGFSPEDLVYFVKLPVARKTDPITEAILKLAAKDQIAVEWSDKQP